MPSKHLDLVDPRLQAEVAQRNEELVILLRAKSLARFIELKLTGAPDMIFGDKYFDLPAGRKVTITCPLPGGWTVFEAKHALSVRSLYDSYGTRKQT